jgi:2-keto-4-pentenoate hydratase
VSIADLAARLETARSDAKLLMRVPDGLVTTLDRAYEVQAELIRLSHADVRGWKVTALSAADQGKFSSTRPVAGPLLGPYVRSQPAQVRASSLIAPLLECEVAFVLGADLPARAALYTQAEIESTIAAIVPVFELADLRVPASAPDLVKLADVMGNGLFVVGQRIDNWRQFDLSVIPITLNHNGVTIDRGSSARILGNPLLAVLALANAQPLPAPGLKAGQIVTTGTCTTPTEISAGTYTADFGPLGSVEMSVVP